MLQVEMSASVRKGSGKGAMRRLRMDGKTPAVVYGAGSEALALQLETSGFFQQLLEMYHRNCIVTLKVDDGSSRHVLVKEVQTDPVRDTLLHADFLEIDLAKPRRFTVPLDFTGKAKGVDFGGELQISKKEVVLEGAPLDIPDDIKVDISPLKIGDSISVGSVSIPDTVKLITNADIICVAVATPGAAAAAAAAAAAE
jgi:large subunit ribosomal protein L25